MSPGEVESWVVLMAWGCLTSRCCVDVAEPVVLACAVAFVWDGQSFDWLFRYFTQPNGKACRFAIGWGKFQAQTHLGCAAWCICSNAETWSCTGMVRAGRLPCDAKPTGAFSLERWPLRAACVVLGYGGTE